MTKETRLAITWVLVQPGGYARPDLYWNAGDNEWTESPDEASEYNLVERDALDLSAFGDGVEWWRRTST
jgi:hypothetical protein